MKPSPAKTTFQRKRAAELKAVFAKKGRKPLGVVAIWPREKRKKMWAKFCGLKTFPGDDNEHNT